MTQFDEEQDDEFEQTRYESKQASSSSKQPPQTSHLSPSSLVAGTLSGAFTHTLTHPLDSVKIRIQAAGRGQKYTGGNFGVNQTLTTTRDILRNEGVRALYQGLSSSILGSSISWGLYFFMYDSSKNYFQKHGFVARDGQITGLGLIMSSLNAGVVTCLVTHPIWLIKTRLQLQQRGVVISGQPVYKGTIDAAWKIATTEGIGRGLYVGLAPSLCLISHGAIHFVCYDLLKQYYIQNFKSTLIDNDQRLNGLESLVLAGGAKSFAALVTYPLQVIKTRLQDVKNKTAVGEARYSGMWDAVKKMYRVEGPGTFFRGIIPHTLKVTPSGAITFAIYEMLQNFLRNMDGQEAE